MVHPGYHFLDTPIHSKVVSYWLSFKNEMDGEAAGMSLLRYGKYDMVWPYNFHDTLGAANDHEGYHLAACPRRVVCKSQTIDSRASVLLLAVPLPNSRATTDNQAWRK